MRGKLPDLTHYIMNMTSGVSKILKYVPIPFIPLADIKEILDKVVKKVNDRVLTFIIGRRTIFISIEKYKY